MNSRRTRRDRGFALRELVVVIVFFVVLALWLMAALSNRILVGKLTAIMANGRSIHTSLASRSLTNIYGTDSSLRWPSYGPTIVTNFQFQTSTELFIDLVTQGVMNVNVLFFAPYGVRPAIGDYPSFTHTNNGWCVVGNVDDSYPDGAPFLFTKNLINFHSMDTPIPADRDRVSSKVLPKDMRTTLGGNMAFVFITKGGEGAFLHNDRIKHRAFTNAFQQVSTNGVRLTNPILRP